MEMTSKQSGSFGFFALKTDERCVALMGLKRSEVGRTGKISALVPVFQCARNRLKHRRSSLEEPRSVFYRLVF